MHRVKGHPTIAVLSHDQDRRTMLHHFTKSCTHTYTSMCARVHTHTHTHLHLSVSFLHTHGSLKVADALTECRTKICTTLGHLYNHAGNITIAPSQFLS